MEKEAPKDIANRMVSDLIHLVHVGGDVKSEDEREFDNAKDCAIISVKYLISETGAKHWYNVKSEILKLKYEDFNS